MQYWIEQHDIRRIRGFSHSPSRKQTWSQKAGSGPSLQPRNGIGRFCKADIHFHLKYSLPVNVGYTDIANFDNYHHWRRTRGNLETRWNKKSIIAEFGLARQALIYINDISIRTCEKSCVRRLGPHLRISGRLTSLLTAN